MDLLKTALSAAGKEATGWALSTIFGAPSKPPEELVEIRNQLTQLGQQLTQISEQLDALSVQLAEAEQAIINEIDYQAYQSRASDLQKEINTLCSLENQLIILTESEPAEDNTVSINNLVTGIQGSADKSCAICRARYWEVRVSSV